MHVYKRLVAADAPVRNDSQEIVDFVETFTMHVHMEPIRGREQMHADQVIADMDMRMYARWTPRNARIGADWRLRYDGTIFDIVSRPVDIDMAHREIEFNCKSGLNQG